jgi:uncharacterized pyridoxamine 5'-phosphate oxidase family protein
MNQQEIFELLQSNPIFYLATADGDQPRTRGMLLFKADANGIVFHTATMRDVFKQVMKNPKVEMCFNDAKSFTQVRVSGILELVEDNSLKDEIAAHPSRQFLKEWKDSISLADFYNTFAVFRLRNGLATIWSFAANLEPKVEVQL